MRSLFFISALLISSFAFSNTTACDNLYSNVSYAYLHTKKAMEATNLDHQTYFAERALVALEKSKTFMNECGCIKADDTSYYAFKSLEKAVSPVDWEAGRYYTKKSRGLINELITILDECTLRTISQAVPNVEYDNGTRSESSTDQSSMVKETQELALLIAQAEAMLNDIERSADALILLLDEEGQEQSEAVKFQQKSYTDRVKALFHKKLKELEKASD